MMGQPGHKTFVAASVILVLFGLVHLIAVYHGNFLPPADERQAEIKRLAMEYTEPLGPFTPSIWGGMQILSSSYSVLLIYAGVLNLLVLRSVRQASRLQTLTLCNVLFIAVLLFITILFQFPPPMIFAAIALILFSASHWKQRAKRRSN